jgi:hypothetical protein
MRSISSISIEEKIYFDAEGQLVIDYERPEDFTESVKKLFESKKAGEATCHIISWNSIDAVLMTIMTDTFPPIDRTPFLQNLAKAITEGEIKVPAGKESAAKAVSDRYLTTINTQIPIIANPTTPDPERLAAIRSYYKHLNSYPKNLRLGNGSWNSSIQQRLDPRAWIHFDGAGKSDIGNDGLKTGAETGHANTFLLTNASDKRQMTALKAVIDQVNASFRPSPALTMVFCKSSGNISGRGCKNFLSSSDNTFARPVDKSVCVDPVEW